MSAGLENYQLLAQLDRGGMSDVYLAATLGPAGFAKLVVLKVLSPALEQQPEYIAMFREEARLSARLSHPCIVQVYETGETEGHLFLVMEYLDGEPLSRTMERLWDLRQLTPGFAFRVISDVLSALEYAHGLRDYSGALIQAIHRDITPQNIFITFDGQVKLVDFGIAKTSEGRSNTATGTVRGKVGYMAPEQARGEAADPRTDLFSVGVVLWELIAGRRLFGPNADVNAMGRLSDGDVPDLRKFAPRVPAPLAEVIMKALRVAREERFSNATEFAAALEGAMPKGDQLSNRALGSCMRQAFTAERTRSQDLIQRQLDLLSHAPLPAAIAFGMRWGVVPNLHQTGPNEAPTRPHRTASRTLGTSAQRGVTTHSGMAASATLGTRLATKSKPKRDSVAPWALLPPIGLLLGAVAVARPWEQEPTRQASAVKSAPAVHPSVPPRAPDTASGSSARIELSGDITEDSTLESSKTYVLKHTTFVAAGVTLRIEPGTTILGDSETHGALVVQPGGKLLAEGTAAAPIVFTSENPPGQRRPGDWGGVVVLGRASLNLKDNSGHSVPGRVEGLTLGGEYGGSDDNDSSGVLRYVRIEYSGTKLGPNNELNGLTLAGVGRGTVIDSVQVRMTADDCFEFFGGTVDARHLICIAPGDDAFDWDYGYRGRLQFLLSQASAALDTEAHGLEGDNDPNGSGNTPISEPLIYNATLCGKSRRLGTEEHYGILARRGTRMLLRNAIVDGFGAALDVRDRGTGPNIASSIFAHMSETPLAFAERPSATERWLVDDDMGFAEAEYLSLTGLANSFRDPQIGHCADFRHPGFWPEEALTDKASAPPADGFFDSSARFIGAFRDRRDHWEEPWARFGE